MVCWSQYEKNNKCSVQMYISWFPAALHGVINNQVGFSRSFLPSPPLHGRYTDFSFIWIIGSVQ